MKVREKKKETINLTIERHCPKPSLFHSRRMESCGTVLIFQNLFLGSAPLSLSPDVCDRSELRPAACTLTGGYLPVTLYLSPREGAPQRGPLSSKL